MSSSYPSDHDRILELLADQAIEGLSAAEQLELESLMRADSDFDTECLDRTAAMLDVAASAVDIDPLLDHLHERILARVRTEFPSELRADVALANAAPSRNTIQWREVVAWASAAACLVLAVFAWSRSPTNSLPSIPSPKLPSVAEIITPQSRPADDEPPQTNTGPTIAELREQLLSSSPDVLHLQLINDNGGGGEIQSSGDIVWSSGQQMGYLRLKALDSDKATPGRVYQVWIVGSDLSGNEIIDGGIFAVEQSTGELILPIQAEQFVQQPQMFVVSVESPGGSSDLVAPLHALTDSL